MRITGWNIEGFGLFNNAAVNGLPEGLVLFHGANEAGKSTLLGFIRGMLFGFPDGRSRELKYPPLAGGRHGGRLQLASSHGQQHTVERFQGKKGGLAVYAEDGSKGGDDTLLRLLGGASPAVFKNVYAFSLGELQDFSSINDEGLKGAIYGGGAGTASHSLPETIKKIDGRISELFLSGGRKPQVNQLLKSLDEVQDQLRAALDDAGAYDQAVADLSAAEARLGECQALLARRTVARGRVADYLKLWNDWLALQDAERSLDALENLGAFPENGVERLERSQGELRQREDRLRQLNQEIDQARDEIARLPVDARLLEQGEAIEILERGREAYEEAQARLPEAGHGIEAAGKEIQRLLDRLGPGWTVRKLTATDRSVLTRDTIHQFAERLGEASNATARAEKSLEVYEKARAEAQRALDKAAQDCARLGSPAEGASPAAIEALQRGRNQYEAIARDIPAVSAEYRTAQEQLNRAIKDIDPRWTVDDIDTFDSSMAAQERIQAFEYQLGTAAQGLADAKAGFRGAEESAAQMAERHKAGAQALAALPRPRDENREALVERRGALRNLRDALQQSGRIEDETAHVDERIADKKAERGRVPDGAVARLPHPAVAAILAAGMGAPFVLGPDERALAWVIAILSVLAALGAAAWLSMHRKGAHEKTRERDEACSALDAAILELREKRESCERAYAALRRQIEKEAPRLGLTSALTLDEVASAEAQTEAHLEAFDVWRRKADDVEELGAETERLAAVARARQAAVEDAEQTSRAAQQAWTGYLGSLGLPDDLTPRTASLLSTKVDAVRKQAREVRGYEERLGQMNQTAGKYRTEAAGVARLAEAAQAEDLMSLVPAVDETLIWWRAQEELRHERDEAERVCAERREKLAHATRDQERAKAELDEAYEKRREAEAEWQAWLEQAGFSRALRPSTALEALKDVEDGLAQVNRRAEQEQQRDELIDRIRSYEQRAQEVFAAAGRGHPSPERLAVAVETLFKDLQASRGNAGRVEVIQGQVAHDEREAAGLRESIAQARTEIEALFATAGASDEDAFRSRGAAVARERELKAQCEAATASIRTISGIDDWAALRAELDATSRDDLLIEEKACQDEIEGLEAEKEEILNRRAELRHTIERLQTSGEIAGLRSREEELLTEIRGACLEWSRYVLAKHLLDAAREKYEKEQQPKVVQDASAFFSRITAGRYTQVMAPIGEDRIEVIDADGARKPPEVLSRGTAEQLYLAIRFGYIRQRAKQSEPLPVVMDDILVNFDPERAQRAAEAIAELGQTHQVMLFTCHPATIDLFQRVRKDVPVYGFGPGGIAPVSTHA